MDRIHPVRKFQLPPKSYYFVWVAQWGVGFAWLSFWRAPSSGIPELKPRNFNFILKFNGLLSNNQYGFRSSRSTGDLLSYCPTLWQETFGKYDEIFAVSLAISKTFNRIWHQALLSKLPSFGFDPPLISLIESFLQCRSMAVTIDGAKSDSFFLHYGVPQGSVLSSTLFLIFINDILNVTSNKLVSFGDDCTLFVSSSFEKSPTGRLYSNSRQEMISSLETDLALIHSWGMKNLVEFNPLENSVYTSP